LRFSLENVDIYLQEVYKLWGISRDPGEFIGKLKFCKEQQKLLSEV